MGLNDDLVEKGWRIGDPVKATRAIGKNVAKGTMGIVAGMSEGSLVVTFGPKKIKVEKLSWIELAKASGEDAAKDDKKLLKVPAGCAFLRAGGGESLKVWMDWSKHLAIKSEDSRVSSYMDRVRITGNVVSTLPMMDHEEDSLIVCKRDEAYEVNGGPTWSARAG